jgi:ABC-type bacteriocin/lantibiotic exporter with double-glycine peptidase domain
VSRDGTSALDLVRAAVRYGLDASGVKADLEDLSRLPLPAILHWGFTHFVVLERVTRNGAVIVDPALGRRAVSHVELSKQFTGVAVVTRTTAAFRKRSRELPGLSRYRGDLYRCLPSLAQILGFTVMLQGLSLALPVGSQILLDYVLAPRDRQLLLGISCGLLGATGARFLLSATRSWVVQNLQNFLDRSLADSFVAHLVRLPLPFFVQRDVGDLLQRLQSNTVLRDLLGTRGVAAILDVTSLLAYGMLLLLYNPALGATVFSLAVLRGLLAHWLRRWSRPLEVAEVAALGRESAALVEALSTIETTKASAAEHRMVERWTNHKIAAVNATWQRRRVETTGTQLMATLRGASLAAVFWIGGQSVLSGGMTIGAFAAFLTLEGSFIGPLESLLRALAQLQLATSHLARLDDVLETEPEREGGADPGTLSGGIELTHVGFAYSEFSPPVLQDVNLRIRAGEKVAIVGRSGAGKSTLARLLVGLQPPSAGTIRYDGRDLSELDLSKTRRQLGVALQETFLFEGTVRENIAVSDPGMPLARIEEAARSACVEDAILALPFGYEARIGENGNRLSGGLRQRLAIARAISTRPRILLLDEASSAVDVDTDMTLQRNLAGLGCTRIVIAHRRATIEDADHVVVVDDGRIVQEGSYEDLLRVSGPFQTLAVTLSDSSGGTDRC